ncbi:LOW QUALITY PROTEIN: PPR domain-containing protein/PPR_2 domain-containing protein/DYW_deaminase domain-containing protein, partial [Cephalotus follicularis]
AEFIFTQIHQPNTFMYNTMIKGYAQSPNPERALQIYGNMKRKGILSENYTYPVLKACGMMARLVEGEEVHGEVVKRGFGCDLFVVNGLIGMYCKCGEMGWARMVFDGFVVKNVISWSIMIDCYARNGNSLEALNLFRLMLCQGTKPDKVSVVGVILACAQLGALDQGRWIHMYMKKNQIIMDLVIQTALVDMYMKCGSLDEARRMFNSMSKRSIVSWNAMIVGLGMNGFGKEALEYFALVKMETDKFTYPFVLKACGDMLLVDIGRSVHGELVVSGFESDIYVENSLIAMYAKFGDMVMARMVFDKMLNRDLTSWNTMVSGYVKNGNPREALVFFELMGKTGLVADATTLLGLLSGCADLLAVKQGKEIHGYVVRNGIKLCNGFLINSLIEMYCVCNSVVDARRLFEGLLAKDVVSWNCIISGYTKIGDAFESLRIFCRMVLEGAKPDQVTLVSVLGACDQITALQFALSVHSSLIKKGFAGNTMVATALINMYSKCGSLACSRHIFDEMPHKNLVSWSVMVTGYGIHGRGRDAISLFCEMLANNVTPDEGVFTSVLSACSHAGLVVEGKEIFQRMTKNYNVKPGPAHYSCLVDLLGRAGHLDEAYDVIKSMEVNPTDDIWTALLSACRQYRNVKLAEIIEQKVFDMNPREVGSYICLSNIYATEKRWNDVDRVRSMLRNKRFKKPPGCSFVELNKMVYFFLVGDRSHPQTKEIYAKLSVLNQMLKKAGYKPDTSSVFYDVKEEVKETMLWDHSERLAIAFSLINTGPGTIIRITKNLRVCGDCHTVTKLISKLMCREIIMRDIHRFHHFRNGFCSCGDYW